LPSLADAGIVILPLPATLVSITHQPSQLPAHAESVVFPSESRFIEFHQILV